MFTSFRKLRISRKLLLSSLAFALPIAVLGFFMDISFVYDINIARKEMMGNRLERRVFRLLKDVPEYRLALAMDEGGRAQDLAAEVEDAIKGVDDMNAAVAEPLRTTPQTMAADGVASLHPDSLRDAWRRIRSQETTGSPHGEEMPRLIDRVVGFMAYVADTSMLTLDPVLDSSYLAQLAVLHVPHDLRGLMEVRHALGMLLGAEGASAGMPSGVLRPDASQRARVAHFVAERENSLATILRSGRIALREDPRFYTASPTLQKDFADALSRFEAAARVYLELLEQLSGDVQGPEVSGLELDQAWQAVHKADCELFTVASHELDILLQKRIDSYTRWRFMGMASSALALAVALALVVVISRGITRPIQSIMQYAHRVRHGDYHAGLKCRYGGEMENLAEDIGAMVQELKHRMAFSQGILLSIAAPFLVTDREGRITFVNVAMLRLLGYDGEEKDYLGSGVSAFFCNNASMDRHIELCKVQRVCVENQEMGLECPGVSKVVSATVSPLYDLDMEELIGVSVFLYDLTRRKEYEAEILEKNFAIERLAAFPRENPAPVLAADRAGEVTYRNPATEDFLSTLDVAVEDFLPTGHGELVAACLDAGHTTDNVEHGVAGRVFSWRYSPLPSQGTVQIHARDITEQVRLREQLVHDAFHDYLTGLPNRALFTDRLDQRIRQHRDQGGTPYAVLVIDLDRFKVVNDSLGHEAGDSLLKEVGARLEKAVSSADTLARLGGDEYAVLLDEVEDATRAVHDAQALQDAVAEAVVLGGTELFLTLSIGIVMGHDDYDSAQDVLRDADTAMYRAKAAGKARSEVFDQDMHERARERLALESELARAVERQEIRVFYQPIVALDTGRIDGFEALVRWQHPERGLVSPAQFIPLAEETGLIVTIGAEVLAQACAQASEWREMFPTHEGLMMSVNLSVRQLEDVELVENVRTVLDMTGLPAEQLKLEVTESGLMRNVSAAMFLLREIRILGPRLSIDDFGTGYSSLSYLPRFPFDFLKVDQSFVARMLENPEDMEIVRAIVSLARGLGKRIIAEGVETAEQLSTLRELGCEYGQGYYFARPLPDLEAEAMLKADPSW